MALWAAVDLQQNQGEIFMRQPLSSKHKMMQGDCYKCHQPWRNVTNEACKNCHRPEKHVKNPAKGSEMDCLKCHREHNGEKATLTAAPESRCLECHNKDKSSPWAHGKNLVSARSGVLLTHKTHFDRDYLMENVCKVCHLPGSFRLRPDSVRPLKDMMLKHAARMRIPCHMCHEEIMAEGFSASGGALNPEKCIGCHRGRLVSVTCGYCHKFHNLSPVEMRSASHPG